MRAGSGEGWLGRPCEGALFVGKDGTGGDDLIDCARTDGKFMRLKRRVNRNLITICIFILHHRIRKRGRDDGIGFAPLLTTCELAAIRAGGQERTATMMRNVGE
jgi:hypothetical protein